MTYETQIVPPQVLVISPEVQSALAAGRPVVALESTIITHGAFIFSPFYAFLSHLQHMHFLFPFWVRVAKRVRP